MTAELNCPSMMELLDTPRDARHAAHLTTCRRCQAQLRHVPESLSVPELSPPAALPGLRARRSAFKGRVRVGAVWQAAAAPDAGVAWVVVIVGHSPQHGNHLLVAPIVENPELATDADLVLDESSLGYAAFIDVANVGAIAREQLLDPIAELGERAGATLMGMYRHISSGAEAPQHAHRGTPAIDEADPRLLAQEERAEDLRVLWRPVNDEAGGVAALLGGFARPGGGVGRK